VTPDALPPLRILAAHLDGHNGGNVDLRLLYAAIRAAGPVLVEPLSSRALVRESWDIVHVYWPEWCIPRNGNPIATSAGAAGLFAQLQVARRRGAKVVWSLNNLRPHEYDGLGIVDGFLSVFSRIVDLAICSSQTLLDEFLAEYPALRATSSRIVRPGHYCAAYPDLGLSVGQARARLGLPPAAKVLLSLGMVRRYKNLLPLVRSWKEVGEAAESMLLIAGSTLDRAFASELREECRGVDSVRLDLKYIEDESIQYYLRAADAFVVPTSLASHSASAMLALSFDCPVIVPRRGTFIEMRETLGAEWVRTYEGGIRARVLRDAVARSRPEGRPDLEPTYEWATAGREYLDAYRHVCQEARTGRGSTT
jgi:beta-1,4-mannosyltransferase